MRKKLIVLALLAGIAGGATAQISIGIGLPHVSIGINLPLYPDLVPVPGYPVYYAPRVEGNYFFYDGLYWVYEDDDWYVSSWYNGPWGYVDRNEVPAYVLRIPVRYYVRPPPDFRRWQREAPPRWNEHWGDEWAQRHAGWDRHDRGAAPPRPPLPVYQRQYSGDRYPRVEQQRELERKNYRYQPRDPVVRQQHDERRERKPEARYEPYRESRTVIRPTVQRPEAERNERQDRAPQQEHAPREQAAPPRQESPGQNRGEAHREQRPEQRQEPKNEQRNDQRNEPRHEQQSGHGNRGRDKHDDRGGK